MIDDGVKIAPCLFDPEPHRWLTWLALPSMKPSCSLPTVRSTLFTERHGTKASALAQQIIFNNIRQYTRLIPPLFVGQKSEAFKYPGGF